jgi:hypothetical protein
MLFCFGDVDCFLAHATHPASPNLFGQDGHEGQEGLWVVVRLARNHARLTSFGCHGSRRESVRVLVRGRCLRCRKGSATVARDGRRSSFRRDAGCGLRPFVPLDREEWRDSDALRSRCRTSWNLCDYCYLAAGRIRFIVLRARIARAARGAFLNREAAPTAWRSVAHRFQWEGGAQPHRLAS